MDFSTKLSLVGIALAGSFAVLAATQWGIGISPDSVSYIGGARSLVDGLGFSMPTTGNGSQLITQYPPFYSFILALPGFLGIDPLASARWINAAIFLLNIFLIGAFTAYSLSNNKRSTRLGFPLVTALLFAAAPHQIEIHAMAWTESLFILLSFAGFYFLARYLSQLNTKNLILSGVLTALAVLTRYAGMALIISGLIVLMIETKPLVKKISDLIIFGFISIIPLGFWMVRNLTATGSGTNRVIVYHPIGQANARQALDTISGWFLVSDTASGWIKLFVIMLVLAIIGSGFYLFVRRNKKLPSFLKIIISFVLLYFGFLIVSISFIDANTPMDNRILSMVFFSVMIFLSFAVAQFLELYSGPTPVIWLVLISMAALLVGFVVHSVQFISTSYNDGLGFVNVIWRQSETIAHVATLPKGIPIYSNAPEAIYILTDRAADRLPSKFQSANLRENQNYRIDLANMENKIEAGEGVVVYFTTIQRSSLPTAQELEQELNLLPDYKASDGVIFIKP